MFEPMAVSGAGGQDGWREVAALGGRWVWCRLACICLERAGFRRPDVLHATRLGSEDQHGQGSRSASERAAVRGNEPASSFPVIPARILIPAGCEVAAIRVVQGRQIPVDDKYVVECAAQPFRPGQSRLFKNTVVCGG